MGPLVFEGTWEEVARHAADLVGRRVRLTVLDEPGPPVDAMSDLLAAAEALAAERGSLPETTRDPGWGDHVLTKFREQGFRL